ncbi:MAG: site-specific integrase, partial [Bacilli bacterium]|nr:site-specific integrase [Bacilli bacterium]
MSEIRRKDNKGRLLFNGEAQEKNGRYKYRYTDVFGKRQTVYSWKLTPTDKMPNGKRKDLSLREKEREIQRDISNGIYHTGTTVLELCKRYIETKRGVKESTLNGYRTTLRTLEKLDFGQKRIENVRMSDAKLFLVSLQTVHGKGYSTIHTIRGVLRPAFHMAVEDKIISTNPFEFYLSDAVINDMVKREAISRQDERKFLEFIAQDKHYSRYYDGMYILFKTGMRISEFCGLTISDIDFKDERINVNKQLQRTNDMRYIIVEPKTKAGKRSLPLNEDVAECFKRIIAKRGKPKKEIMIDGYAGFLWLDKNGMPMVAQHWEKYFQLSVRKYN